MNKINQITDSKNLREKSKEAKPNSKETALVIDKMKEILEKKDNGLALAAPQIGINLRIIVISKYQEKEQNISIPNLTIINPEVIEHSEETTTLEEGCLSVAKPEIRGKVDRYKSIKISYRDPEGKKKELVANDFLARIIQHEIDHLNGVVFIDRADPNTLHQVEPDK
jgi:peptide deformylase